MIPRRHDDEHRHAGVRRTRRVEHREPGEDRGVRDPVERRVVERAERRCVWPVRRATVPSSTSKSAVRPRNQPPVLMWPAP